MTYTSNLHCLNKLFPLYMYKQFLLRQCKLLVHVTWKELVTTMQIACTCNVERACYDNANCLYMSCGNSLLRQCQLLVHVTSKEPWHIQAICIVLTSYFHFTCTSNLHCRNKFFPRYIHWQLLVHVTWKELVTTMAIACTWNVEKSLLRQCQLLVHVTWKELVTTMAIACTCNVEKSLLRPHQCLCLFEYCNVCIHR
jgi:hypothetical protein